MEISPLDLGATAKAVVAVVIGFITGFALLKSDLIWRKSIMDILTLKDGRLLKCLLFFIAIGTLGFYLLERAGVVNVHILPSYLWASIVGGIIAGIGLVICGFTPLTAITNLCTGRLYTVWTIIGMLVALPVVKFLNDEFASKLYGWSEKFATPASNSEGTFYFIDRSQKMFSFSNGALVVFCLCCILIVIVQFTLGDSSED